MDVQSGELEEEEVMGEGIGESEMEELVPEWGWRRDNDNYLHCFKALLSFHPCHTHQKSISQMRIYTEHYYAILSGCRSIT